MRERRRQERVSRERWLVSYADFITLLFAFFVVLYAVSTSEHNRAAEISVSIDSAMKKLSALQTFTRSMGPGFTNDMYTGAARLPSAVRILTAAGARNDLEQMREHLQRSLGKQIAADIVSLRMGPDGLVISLHEGGFFNSGSAVPLPDSRSVLNTIGRALRDSPYEVRVEGHTDNTSIHTERFISNWELSAARATNIAQILLALHCVPPDHLSVAGYGEYRPVASNATATGRAHNRRVDLVVFPRVQLDSTLNSSRQDPGQWKTILETAPRTTR